MNSFFALLNETLKKGKISDKIASHLTHFAENYLIAAEKAGNKEKGDAIIKQYLDFILKECTTPFSFGHYHQQCEPQHRFGLEYFRNIVDLSHSVLLGGQHLDRIASQVKKGENVFLLANHQTEGDPQLIQLLLEKDYPDLAETMIFVAGHRVTSDPIAKPFSMGCNLLCIYSKKHIEHPPEQRGEKLAHNQGTMKEMRRLLSEGGCCIYIAPSGGRDRQKEGRYVPDQFDPSSLEMTLLQGKRVNVPTHYYPLTLLTYPVLPPPEGRQRELGEIRNIHSSPVFLAFGDEIAIETLPGEEITNKTERRQRRTDFIWQKVYDNYERLESLMKDKPET